MTNSDKPSIKHLDLTINIMVKPSVTIREIDLSWRYLSPYIEEEEHIDQTNIINSRLGREAITKSPIKDFYNKGKVCRRKDDAVDDSLMDGYPTIMDIDKLDNINELPVPSYTLPGPFLMGTGHSNINKYK